MEKILLGLTGDLKEIYSLRMKQSQFITLMSQSLRREEKTIRTIVRFLREAGLFTTGARGVNAPDLTSLDAVRVIIAVVASTSPGKAVRDVQYFGKLKPDLRATDAHLDLPDCLNADETLEEALVKCFEDALPYSAIALGRLTLSEQGDAVLRIGDRDQAYHQREQWEAVSSLPIKSEEWKAAIRDWEGMNRIGGDPVPRSAHINLETIHQIGFEMIGWEVD
ncbi:hypothetical protein [Thioclava sediminum]|nr:hypothetical protein [Thioclava sediminum]